MAQFIWCKNEERRIPSFRCVLCRKVCPGESKGEEADTREVFRRLVQTGKYRERFVMKRKEDRPQDPHTPISPGAGEGGERERQTGESQEASTVFILEEGRLKPFVP